MTVVYKRGQNVDKFTTKVVIKHNADLYGCSHRRFLSSTASGLLHERALPSCRVGKCLIQFHTQFLSSWLVSRQSLQGGLSILFAHFASRVLVSISESVSLTLHTPLPFSFGYWVTHSFIHHFSLGSMSRWYWILLCLLILFLFQHLPSLVSSLTFWFLMSIPAVLVTYKPPYYAV